MNKILFLDMDGVLNSSPSKKIRELWKRTINFNLYNQKLYGIDPELASHLKFIIDKTNCKIVFSTSWRYFEDHPTVGPYWRDSLADILQVNKLEVFIDDTPDISICDWWESGAHNRRRGVEIKYWLNIHSEIAIPGNFRFCVIDDEVSDILPIISKDNIVHTDMKYGLQMHDAQRAIKILNGYLK